ncbi:MAG: ribosome biogenesis GTPase YqeH [Fusobacterium sp. JB021]|nr:ribosome biogenesis GTPase YqeH [Fusobacterium sp. JB021]
MSKKCVGCGVELQSEDKNKSGYLPKSALENKNNKGKDLYCQRCFKIKNYGEYIPVEMTREDYRREVHETIEDVDLVLAVFDVIDFEGSFDDEILDILREKESIVVLNKIDLIPGEKHPSEVADWAKYRLGEEGIAPLDIAIVSSKNTYGISGIYKKINHFFPKRAKVAVLGVTNVGKSSIINRLVGQKIATESKYPGTTLKSSKKKLTNANITLIDTPGLIPEGRFSDLVCENCNLDIVPSMEISRKTYKEGKDRVIFIGGLVKIRIIGDNELKPIFSVYASKNVSYHDTNLEKAEELIASNRSDLFYPPCKSCLDDLKKEEIVTEKFEIETGEEIVFKGLAWLSVKRGPLNIEITYPKKGEIIIRKAFIKPKR